MSRICISHTYEGDTALHLDNMKSLVVAHLNFGVVAHIRMRHVTHRNESCHTNEHVDKSCHTNEGDVALQFAAVRGLSCVIHMQSHVTHVKSHVMCNSFMSHVWKPHGVAFCWGARFFFCFAREEACHIYKAMSHTMMFLFFMLRMKATRHCTLL